ncbi:MAG TPA: quinol:cytochrome C oxidoreductase, partial [Bacteroidia bacterium]|nr:quinol:cytochrome C oxidoreductase [Bacteroidia bacterium]
MQDNLTYTFSSKLKTLSFILMAIGAISIGISFATNPDQTWANLMHNNFYFLTIALGGLFFYAVQYAA